MSDAGSTGLIQKPPQKTGRGLKIALACSLALNLMIAGLVAGAVLGAGPRGDDQPALRALGLGPFALALTREDRAEMRGRIDGRATRSDRQAIGQSLVALQTALRADPFDRPMAEAAMARSRNAARDLQAFGHDALLDQIESMDARARADLADRLGRVLRRVNGRGGDRP